MLTDLDVAIIQQTKQKNDPSIFTNWYMRRKYDTGTYYEAGDTREYWAGRYEGIWNKWNDLGRPDHFGEINGVWQAFKLPEFEEARAQLRNVYEVQENETFFQHHGYRFLPWQAQMYQAKQGTVVCVGGMSSGKTTAAINTVLVYAATLPFFYAICPAPSHDQAAEMFDNKIIPHLEGTEYQKVFNVQFKKSPRLHIELETLNGAKSYIFFRTLGDKQKLKNLEVDMFYVEQAEDFQDLVSGPDNIYSIIQTRLRGRIKGRPRLAKSLWIANASYNMEIYALRDRAIDDPQNYLSIQTSTYDNPHISQQNVSQLEAIVGDDEDQKRYLLYGDKPMSGGEHFPQHSLAKVFDSQLDDAMRHHQANHTMGWEVKTARGGVGVYHWRRPYEPDGQYIVFADPGQGNPPKRNSAAVMVFRVDGFPLVPASLYMFDWVYGNGSPEPWIASFVNAVKDYRAIGSCAYDATGLQAGYERMEKKLYECMPVRVNLNLINKNKNLNALKMMFARGHLQMPMIEGLYSQLMLYTIPEPSDLRQDLVMTLVVGAELLAPIYNEHVWRTEKRKIEIPEYDRFERPVQKVSVDRWARRRMTR